jgi:hypothetical protein
MIENLILARHLGLNRHLWVIWSTLNLFYVASENVEFLLSTYGIWKVLVSLANKKLLLIFNF